MLARKEVVGDNFQELDLEKQRELEKKIAIKKKNNARRRSRFTIVSTAIVGFTLALTVLFGYSSISNMKVELSKLESNRINLENEIEHLEINLEEIKSVIDIEGTAILKLGMDYPKSDQIVYIDVNKVDGNIAKENKGLFKSIFNSIQSLF